MYFAYSAGVLAYQLLTGRLPFIGDNGLLVSKLYMSKQIFSNKDVFRAILYADLDFTGKPWDEISQDAKDLVQKLLTRDASRRPTAAEALSHPWFQVRATASLCIIFCSCAPAIDASMVMLVVQSHTIATTDHGSQPASEQVPRTHAKTSSERCTIVHNMAYRL